MSYRVFNISMIILIETINILLLLLSFLIIFLIVAYSGSKTIISRKRQNPKLFTQL